MDRKLRVRVASTTTAAGLLAALALGVAASQAEDPGTTFDQTFTTPTETTFPVPDGVTTVDVVATGGRGANVSNNMSVTATGGLGAVVSGRLSGLTPGQTLYLEVGGNGQAGGIHSAGAGGFNGGGTAQVGSTSPSEFYNSGGGGGGASDVRTAPRADGLSPDPRLIVAAGGGGAGHPINGSGAPGGNGGAGWKGFDIGGATGDQGASGGGGGGSGATVSAGGAAGSAGTGSGGTAGSLGQGGNGGTAPNNDPAGGGGGGGGGLYGGGGARGGLSAASGGPTGGGGGGGGSSLVPAGGSIALASSGSNGSIEISYSIPGTDIGSGPTGSVTETTQSFTFSSSDPDATFECRFDSTDVEDFAPCTSPYTATDLALGQHTFDVRAFNSMGNFDPTPASDTFTVETVPPPTTTTPTAPGPSQPAKKAKCKKKKHKKAAAAKKKKCKKKRKKR